MIGFFVPEIRADGNPVAGLMASTRHAVTLKKNYGQVAPSQNTKPMCSNSGTGEMVEHPVKGNTAILFLIIGAIVGF